MDRKDLAEQFERDVAFLQKSIAPDDIYIFAEHTYRASLFFLRKLAEAKDILEIMHTDPIANAWISNLVRFKIARENRKDITLDFNLEDL